jgi:hypothetical protein
MASERGLGWIGIHAYAQNLGIELKKPRNVLFQRLELRFSARGEG